MLDSNEVNLNKKKTEDSKKVDKRVKKFISTHGYKRLQIYVTDNLKLDFDSLKDLECNNNTEKLEKLIECWNKSNELKQQILEMELQLKNKDFEIDLLKNNFMDNEIIKTLIPLDSNEIKETTANETLILKGLLEVTLENNNSFVRGKKRSLEDIEFHVLESYKMKKKSSGKYHIFIEYENKEDLEDTIYRIFQDIDTQADYRACHIQYLSLTNLDNPEEIWD